jgi:hypothetical protein
MRRTLRFYKIATVQECLLQLIFNKVVLFFKNRKRMLRKLRTPTRTPSDAFFFKKLPQFLGGGKSI